jgi:hypothetical protein
MKWLISLGVLAMLMGASVALAGNSDVTAFTAPTSGFGIGSPTDPNFAPTWTTFTAPATNADRIVHGTVYDPAGDKFYIVGGNPAGAAGTYMNTIYRYDPVAATWNTGLTVKPTPLGWVTATLVRGKIYVIGGHNNAGGFEGTNQAYDIAANTWATLLVRPIAAGCHEQLAYRDSLIYCLGGYVSNGVTTVNIYNTFTNTWAVGTALPQAFDMGGACMIRDTMYIIGGLNRPSNLAYTNVIRGAINPATPTTITWTSQAALPVPNCINGTTALGGKGYMLGGFENLGTVTAALQEYDPATNTFATLDPYPYVIARNHYIAARPSENALYVFGGDVNGDWAAPNNYYYVGAMGSGVEVGKIIIGRDYSQPVLAQNRPNPVKTTTRIEFALPRAGDVSLKLYNVSGQEVKALVNGNMGAGSHSASLNVQELPAGVYIYRLAYEGLSLSKTLSVVR